MCFSPEASFTGGILISIVGVAAIKKVYNPSQIVFASIPLFFAVQQFAEGFLWLALPNPEYMGVQKFTTYLFLFFANVIWPILIPLSVLFLENNQKKRKIILGLTVTGILLSFYYAFCLLFYNVTPQIMNYHIQYTNDFPKSLALIAFIVYIIVTLVPLFISSIKKIKWFGVLLFLSCLFTGIIFTQYLTSVWCFFAAFISVVIFWILRDSKIKIES